MYSSDTFVVLRICTIPNFVIQLMKSDAYVRWYAENSDITIYWVNTPLVYNKNIIFYSALILNYFFRVLNLSDNILIKNRKILCGYYLCYYLSDPAVFGTVESQKTTFTIIYYIVSVFSTTDIYSINAVLSDFEAVNTKFSALSKSSLKTEHLGRILFDFELEISVSEQACMYFQ